jgi:hypothetical protein
MAVQSITRGMRRRDRDRLLEITASMLDGARQLPYLEPVSVRRMGRDILEAVDLIDAPGYAEARERLADAAQRLSTDAHADAAAEVIEELRALRERLQAGQDLIHTVVFMPYHAAMWDCLHSIWAAADADPRVEAIVVPVPYVDRKPDGSPGEWHLHLHDLPPEVPVTPYTEFDVAATHPDVIYVHNPYDANNRVTSVAPQFYSSALRPHTDLLVYVPYYVSGTSPGEHLYSAPSFELFDKVIVQSEQIDHPVIERWTSNKVVPLGSPKFDHVRTPGSPLPAGWREQIAGRTVLLQLTSLATLLSAPEAAVRKLEEVLDAVQDSHDLALWWRPHPLEQATITSMIPRVAELYGAYLDRAQRSDRVIVDTTFDLQRAIHTAHAYYGHWSSVTELFGFTGKPMVIQDPRVATDVPRPQGPADEGPNAALSVFARPEWFVYEGALTYLRRALREGDGRIAGQHEHFAALTAHADGSAGHTIHEYVMSCVRHPGHRP